MLGDDELFFTSRFAPLTVRIIREQVRRDAIAWSCPTCSQSQRIIVPVNRIFVPGVRKKRTQN